jgi:hypothetical protein
MIGIFADYDVSDQPFGWQAALDQARWCRRLDHRARATPASILGSTHDQEPELGRDHVQPLGHILADGMQ